MEAARYPKASSSLKHIPPLHQRRAQTGAAAENKVPSSPYLDAIHSPSLVKLIFDALIWSHERKSLYTAHNYFKKWGTSTTLAPKQHWVSACRDKTDSATMAEPSARRFYFLSVADGYYNLLNGVCNSLIFFSFFFFIFVVFLYGSYNLCYWSP